ncbi:MAG: sulfatase [Acidobacteriota bacterium]
MTIRIMLGIIVAGLWTARAPFTTLAGSDRTPTNVLLVTIDTLRADHLSSYGYHLKTSPRMDRLAEEGVRFEKAYTVIPLTGPSHFSLFTSRYPQEHGARINGVSVPDKAKWIFLPQIFKAAGYHNAAYISAWPLTDHLTHLDRWFDVYDEELNRSYQWLNSSRYAEDVTPRASQWLRKKRKEPFFMWVHYFDPHSPYDFRKAFPADQPSGNAVPAVEWRDAKMRDRIRSYDSEIAYTDYHLGRLLDTLDELGLRDSTLVVVTSDHGESLGEHGYVGHGRHLSEAIIRVPLIMRWPGVIPAGRTISAQATLVDLAPTVVDLVFGTEKLYQSAQTFSGRTFKPAILDEAAVPHRPIRYLTFAGKKGWAPRWVSWIWVHPDTLPLRLGETDGTLKRVWTPRDRRLVEVDLSGDPLELNPKVYHDEMELYRTETAELREWFAATDLNDAKSQLNRKDEEILKSLGYTQ